MIYNTNGVSPSAFTNGLNGYKNASEQLTSAANDLANSQLGNKDITKASISLLSAQTQAQASVEIIERSDSMLGTIIDIYV